MSPPGLLAFAQPAGVEAAPYTITAFHPADHARHALHDETRDWPETNCYVDLWIELLAARGFAPEAALGFTLTQDFVHLLQVPATRPRGALRRNRAGTLDLRFCRGARDRAGRARPRRLS